MQWGILSNVFLMFWIFWGFVFAVIIAAVLIIIIFWVMIKGGISTEVLLLKSGGEWGRIYKAKESERYVEFGKFRFLRRDTQTTKLKPKELKEGEKPKKSKKTIIESKPLTFWRRARARRLFAALEGQPVLLDWRKFSYGLEQTPATAEEIKKSERQALLRTGIHAFMSRVKQSKLFWLSIGLVLIGLGFFMGMSAVLSGAIPIP